ncbi:MAG: FGGY-family carbohydrate kinase [Caldilineaceae bacterium]
MAVIDAFSAVYAGQTTAPGVMAIILGTSTCHMLIAKEKIPVPGVTGLVKDAFIPGYYGYEAGQAATGDILAWFVRRGCRPSITKRLNGVRSASMRCLRKQRPNSTLVRMGCSPWIGGMACAARWAMRS